MSRLSLYELRLAAALSLCGNEAAQDELAGLFERRRELRRAIEGLAQLGVVIEDRAAGRVRLLPGRAAELLGLSRGAVQAEMFSEECLLPDPGGGAPPTVAGAHTQGPHTHERVIEISDLNLMSSVESVGGTQLNRRERAQAEAAATAAAVNVSARYRQDGYVMEKLDTQPRLKRELLEGRTPTARKFAVLHASDPDRARELLGAAVTMRPNPGAWLNVVLKSEGVTY